MKDCGECSFSGWMQRAAVLSKDTPRWGRQGPVSLAHTYAPLPQRPGGALEGVLGAATGRHALLLRPLAD